MMIPKRISTFMPCVLSALLFVSSYAAESSLVYDDSDGVLRYETYPNQDQTNSVNTVPDFSRAGYQGGGVPIPFIPAVLTIEAPTGGDDRALIQTAIDAVEAMELQPNGFRGAVLIKAGNYQVSSTLMIDTGGVVIRGEGSQFNGGTRITMTANEMDTLFEVTGKGALSAVGSTIQTISDPYVPVGSKSFNVASTAGYAVGDSVLIQNTVNETWIADIKMNNLTDTDPTDTDWTASGTQLYQERTVTGIDGNTLTVDAPMVQAIEDVYGGARVYRYTFGGSIENVGFEALRLESTYQGNADDAHGWTGVRFVDTRNGWMRQVTGQNFGLGLVTISGTCLFFTIEDCAMIDHKSRITGGSRYSFYIDDCSYVLMQRCYTRGGRHDFVAGSKTFGPNVFVDGRSDETYNDNGPHLRYSTGQLYDNIKCGDLNVWNRGNAGGGHGWSGAQVMFWNCDVSTVRCESPTGAMNWAIGCVGTRNPSGNEPEGFFESHGTHVTPRSLYYRQLRERLGTDALLSVILPQQAAGTIWNELQAWGGDGLFLDDLVVWHDVSLGTADLRGIVRNLQMLDNGITALWSKVSGPGAVSFADATALETGASFSASGDYVLQLVVDDGHAQVSKEVAITVDSTLSPIAHWKFDDGSGSTAADHSGNSHDGIIDGAIWVSGRDGGALDFDRVAADKVTIPATVFENISNEISVAFWAYGDAAVLPASTTALVATDASGYRVFNISLPFSNRIIYWDAGNSGTNRFDRINKAAATSEYEGQWNHWVFTKNAVSGVMEIYLNGLLWHSGSGYTRTMSGITSAHIGSNEAIYPYDGALDDYQIYDTALNSTEVMALYHEYLPAAPAFASALIVGAPAIEDSDYSATILDSAIDPDFDQLTFSKVSGPNWLSVASDGTLSGKPAGSDVGPNSFVVEVNDSRGGSDNATLEITVNAGNWTVYTVTGFDNNAGTITTDHGVLNSGSTFVSRDVLVVDEKSDGSGMLNGFTFDGWNLSNLTIRAGILQGSDPLVVGDNHFQGITFAPNTVVDGLTMHSNRSFRHSPEAVFSGGVSGVTFTGTQVLQDADELLASTDWSGAIIRADSGIGWDIGSIDWGTVNVDFNGVTIHAGSRFIRDGDNYDAISWEGVTLNIHSSEIWRHYNGSGDDLGAQRGVVGRNWDNSTINATGGSFFDSYNRNGFSGTYTFDGADVNGDLFSGASNSEISQPTTVDFSGADVSDLTPHEINDLTNLTVMYDPATTIFGTYTRAQAIADGWIVAEGVDPYDAWAAVHPWLIDSAPDFDQEADGMSNLMEYAFGANPMVADAQTFLPHYLVDGDFLYYVYRRQNPKDPKLTYQVLWGDDLMVGLNNPTIEVDVSTVNDGFESVTNALPMATEPRGFMHLKIEHADD